MCCCACCKRVFLGSRGVQGSCMGRARLFSGGPVAPTSLHGFAGDVACEWGSALVRQSARPCSPLVGAGLVRVPRLCRTERAASGASPARGGADHQTCFRVDGSRRRAGGVGQTCLCSCGTGKWGQSFCRATSVAFCFRVLSLSGLRRVGECFTP